ncbi:AraC family transcriptional regulator [Cohnella sp. REN36]|uniref:AraC family transcriptional regulator n=1 Tax=Cohnella sp. REN36 TaxID=2887347 RepID=UPI001D15122D|nr:AraC family transcriptional regulator [Cohnella sp. REN36]MCC3373879.1 AraC family transcriptional regulator [Cohnella sp. REN36]
MQTVDTVQRAIDYIEERLAEQVTLEEIGRAAAMSVPNLYRLFYALTGHPIKEYIRKRRTSEAAVLLRQTELSAKEIGFACGFDAYQTFLKTFKRCTGLTPGLYRTTGTIYHFERIHLQERVAYAEEREVSERYQDVKVIRLAPQRGVSWLHVADREEGMEEEAFARFASLLSDRRIDPGRARLFGWNAEPGEGTGTYGYRMAAVGDEYLGDAAGNTEPLEPVEMLGGTYAVTWTPPHPPAEVRKTWDLLLSEWLPRSRFELGEHGFLEEYQTFNGRLARMKLYLPVRRSEERDGIEIAERAPVKVVTFRAEGTDCASRADAAASAWLTRRGLAGDRRLQVFMRCSYGTSPEESQTYEIGIAVPEALPSAVLGEEDRLSELAGGSYACLATRAYGSMTGVLERIYRWLAASETYALDDARRWYACYLPADHVRAQEDEELERSIRAVCCVPVVRRQTP